MRRVQSRLIEDILDANRILHGKLNLENGPLELGSVVRSAVGDMESMSLERGVAIAVEGTDEAGSVLPILGDGLRLQQVFWNLLTNAVKFSPRGSEVRVRMGQDESDIWVKVIDQGKGIDHQFLPYVFQRLSQAAGATTQRRSGLGLGLAIVWHIVELHGGSVRAASDGADRGATFTVVLPREGQVSGRPVSLVAGREGPGGRGRNGNPRFADPFAATQGLRRGRRRRLTRAGRSSGNGRRTC